MCVCVYAHVCACGALYYSKPTCKKVGFSRSVVWGVLQCLRYTIYCDCVVIGNYELTDPH